MSLEPVYKSFELGLKFGATHHFQNSVRFVAVIRSHKHGLYFIFAVLKQKAQGLAGKTAVRAELFAQFYVGVYSRLLVFEPARKYEVGGKEIVRRVVGALEFI